MAEVHEICKTEYERLLGKEWNGKPYQEVYCRWFTGDLSGNYLGPTHVDLDSHSWNDLDKAVEDCSRWERLSISDLLEHGFETLVCIEIWHVVDDIEDIAIEPLHDAPYSHMGKGGKGQNWHLLIKFDGDDSEYRLTSADDAREFINIIESIYQLEATNINN